MYPIMSAANSRASGLSVGKNSTMQSQSFSSCQWGSKSSLRFVPKIARSPFSESFGSKLAVQERYNESPFFRVLSCSLQGVALRPLPCNYNVIQSSAPFHGGNTGSNPVGDANLINHLQIPSRIL